MSIEILENAIKAAINVEDINGRCVQLLYDPKSEDAYINWYVGNNGGDKMIFVKITKDNEITRLFGERLGTRFTSIYNTVIEEDIPGLQDYTHLIPKR